MLRLALYIFSMAMGEVILPLPFRHHGSVGFSTRGPSAFRLRILRAWERPFESPMVKPDEADAPFSETTLKQGRGISSSFGSLVLSDRGSLVLLDSNGQVITESQPLTAFSSISLSSEHGELYGRGAGPEDATELIARDVTPTLKNKYTYVPHYYSTDGYAALGVSSVTTAEVILIEGTSHIDASYKSDGEQIVWSYSGSFELYLMPAASLDMGSRAYLALIGAPRVPPMYAFGFLASRWGWKDRHDAQDIMKSFRNGSFPVDAYISDFEWFAPLPDYVLPHTGVSWYHDFGFRKRMFPNPKHDLSYDREALQLRFGGIRKTRLGNSDLLMMARSKGWIQLGGFRHAGVVMLALISFGFVLLICLLVCVTYCCCVSWRNKQGYSAMRAGDEECPHDTVETSKEESVCRNTEGKPLLESTSKSTGSSSIADASTLDQFVEAKLTQMKQFLPAETQGLASKALNCSKGCCNHCCSQRCCSTCLCLLVWIGVVAYTIFIFMFWEGRNLDFSQQAVRTWYADQTQTYLDDGVAFWWNDEGENSWYQYHWWNTAELEALRRKSATERFFSLNRGFTPGLARMGATTWTGDVSATWDDLATQPGLMLNWALAGAPYVSMDIGGFNGETNPQLLVRWYQMGTLFPNMRIHSNIFVTPHWPFLWGAEAAKLMRHAMELRYRLIPYHYSLAHAMFSKQKLWMSPLALAFPGDDRLKYITTQWMDGDLLVAPIVREDSKMQVDLPAGKWFLFNSTSIVQGPDRISGKANLEDIPVYARAGTILPLGPVVQSTSMLPGGPLEVQVYTGANGAFDLVEDDGTTTNYEKGHVRTTRFKWDDTKGELTWKVNGKADNHAFTHLFITYFREDGITRSAVKPLAGPFVRKLDRYTPSSP